MKRRERLQVIRFTLALCRNCPRSDIKPGSVVWFMELAKRHAYYTAQTALSRADIDRRFRDLADLRTRAARCGARVAFDAAGLWLTFKRGAVLVPAL